MLPIDLIARRIQSDTKDRVSLITYENDMKCRRQKMFDRAQDLTLATITAMICTTENIVIVSVFFVLNNAWNDDCLRELNVYFADWTRRIVELVYAQANFSMSSNWNGDKSKIHALRIDYKTLTAHEMICILISLATVLIWVWRVKKHTELWAFCNNSNNNTKRSCEAASCRRMGAEVERNPLYPSAYIQAMHWVLLCVAHICWPRTAERRTQSRLGVSLCRSLCAVFNANIQPNSNTCAHTV